MSTGKLILIVEDEPDAARLMEHHLHLAGLRTVWTEGGMHALQAVSLHKPDLVVLDLMLPGLGGLEVCRIIKSDPHTKHIPIIMVTALGTEEDILRGFGRGTDDYLKKPFHMSELVVRIFSLLRRVETGCSSSLPQGQADPHPSESSAGSWAIPEGASR